MHIYYLISPNCTGLNYNPGVSLIAYGCRHLIKQADPEAYFIPISNIVYDEREWDILLEQADCLVLPGGSLYDPGDISVYWNDTIWQHIAKAQARGIPFADLWGYSSYPFPPKSISKSAADILNQPRTMRTLEVQNDAALIVTRDALAEYIVSSVYPRVQTLPCASFWSPNFFNIKPSMPIYNCVSVFPIVKDKWFAEALFAIGQVLSEQKPTYFICHTNPEFQWFRSFFPDIPNVICLYDPISLLEFYSKCDKVVSARLHAAIPAFALHSNIIYISFDSRSLALDLFRIKPIPYTDLKSGAIPFDYISLTKTSQPDPSPFINLFMDKIVSKLRHG